jgi:hypothetical protein
VTLPAVAILVPVLARPHRVALLMADVAAATPTPHRLLFVVGENDRGELAALRKAGADFLVVPSHRRKYSCKINDGVAATDEPLIFTGADDLHFHPRWLDEAVAAMDLGSAFDGGPPCRVVGTNDLTNPRVMAGEHSTHSLVPRAYVERGTIDEPGVLLHEGYPHEYVDDEFVGTAIARGLFVSAPRSVVEHLHPYRKLAPVDATYRLAWQGRPAGKRLYEKRRVLWQT